MKKINAIALVMSLVSASAMAGPTMSVNMSRDHRAMETLETTYDTNGAANGTTRYTNNDSATHAGFTVGYDFPSDSALSFSTGLTYTMSPTSPLTLEMNGVYQISDRIGIKAGLNYSKYINSGNYRELSPGFQAGVVINTTAATYLDLGFQRTTQSGFFVTPATNAGHGTEQHFDDKNDSVQARIGFRF